MYCPSCGIDAVEGLRYCKRCGVNLTSPGETLQPRSHPFALVIALLIFIGAVFTTGLTMPFLITKELSNRGFTQSDMMAMFIIELGVTLAVVSMLVRLLFRVIGTNQQTGLPARVGELRRDGSAAHIAALPEPAPSVTEHTTRSFDSRIHDNLNRVGISAIDT